MIGLAGAHRTGKSTLARAFCQYFPQFRFVETNLSAVFARYGVSPKDDLPFHQRLNLQNLLLDELELTYRTAKADSLTVTDRTPIDVLAYTMAEVRRETLHDDAELTKRFNAHQERCKSITARYISLSVVVQPGIEIVEHEAKAPGCAIYMNHLNMLIKELLNDLHPYYGVIPRGMIDLESRVRATFQIYTALHAGMGEQAKYARIH